MSWSQIPTFIRTPDGSVYVNPAKDYVVPFDLTTDRPNNVVTLAANQQNVGIPMTARFDGPIEAFCVKAIVLDNTNAPVVAHGVTHTIEHGGKRKRLMNRPIHLRSIQGDAGRAYILPETIWIPSVQALFVTFNNGDAAERRVEFVLGSAKYYPHAAPQDIRREIYGYTERRERTYCYWQTTDAPVALAASATGIEAFYTVPDDADLEVFKYSAVSDAAFRVEHIDGQTDRSYTSARIHGSLFFGGFSPTAILSGAGGVFPGRLPTTLFVRRSAQGKLVFDNLSALTNNIFVTLGGRKVSYV